MASSSTHSASTGGSQQDEANFKHSSSNFLCIICGLNENCFYGKLTSGNGHYPHEVYYMRDPFDPPSKKGRKPMLFDFLVLGSTCHLCSRSSCSIYFGNHFCSDCISRERRSFPDEVLQLVMKAQDSHIVFSQQSTDASTIRNSGKGRQ